MAGGLTISTLNDSSGVLATQNGMSGIAKAWVRFVGSTGAITGSFNVSSVTRSGTGTYTVNFTTAMPDTNYGFTVGSVGDNNNPYVLGNQNGGTYSTTALGLYCCRTAMGYQDPPLACISIFR